MCWGGDVGWLSVLGWGCRMAECAGVGCRMAECAGVGV